MQKFGGVLIEVGKILFLLPLLAILIGLVVFVLSI